jgi:hypothetical protein
MKKAPILGASGNIAKHVVDLLVEKDDIKLILFCAEKPECIHHENH